MLGFRFYFAFEFLKIFGKCEKILFETSKLEALAVNNGWAALIVFLLEIHICWKVEREARMDPPIQTEYFLSGGAMILILMVDGARAVISFCIRSAIPGYMVVPPDMTVFPCRSLRISTSHFMMEL